ncbi:2-amino-4-hydroxy-6-hydroxymethyldihydropteridine diphosphokinase [Rubrobacter aplysinae]|uniref:2-amino-4-hydroxy-6- hydroxymethyldihydropteridine diphosphokinase n=1 Tax=Rubrobacter aplysinae TaxID=909625 RepID=UPI00069E8AD3|nr:2-amino-4-hydroxy-6-hydroxymethyldihydropteridine diphosphokinase [Rubrobacter aplysinae]
MSAIRAFLSLGSNLGDRAGYLRAAVAALGRSDFSCVSRVSAVYETEPVEVEAGHPDYLNCAVELSCEAGAVELLRYCQGVEAALGRSEKGEKAPRTVDVDVLLYGKERADIPGLGLPHRGVTRAFNLVTLADLDPRLYIPGVGVVGGLRDGLDERELAGVRRLGRLDEI